MPNSDKRLRAARFRRRLARAMTDQSMSQSALARAIGIDRSTVSQFLSPDTARLPNAQIAAECAAALGVSSDWLLGLSDRPEQAADLLASSLEMSETPRDQLDEQLFNWHHEARGYKIRQVPARLPDMLKTEAMLRWEYEPHLGKTTDQAIGASSDGINLMRDALSDYEIAIPLFEAESFARGEGYYRNIPRDVRQDQIKHLIGLHDELYPNLRIFLFDARRLHSAPITIFGPLLAALYLGQHYLIFRDSQRISAFTKHFDVLVREATITPREFPDYLTAIENA